MQDKQGIKEAMLKILQKETLILTRTGDKT